MLIKGGGAALTREKIVAAASRRFVCIIDDSKLVDRLGAFPLPVEVIPMARSYVASELAKLGGRARLARRSGHRQRQSDPGRPRLDADEPEAMAMEDTINGIAGVVTVGLFAHRGADVLLVAGDAGIETILLRGHQRRPRASAGQISRRVPISMTRPDGRP